jgi:hypothetical protein
MMNTLTGQQRKSSLLWDYLTTKLLRTHKIVPRPQELNPDKHGLKSADDEEKSPGEGDIRGEVVNDEYAYRTAKKKLFALGLFDDG